MERGRAAEEVAVRYLKGRGWEILDRNVRFPGGELDIVARQGRDIVFVEVRSSRRASPFPPEASLGPRKKRNLIRAAAAWLGREGLGEALCRFDLIAVEFTGPRMAVRHYPGAFVDDSDD